MAYTELLTQNPRYFKMAISFVRPTTSTVISADLHHQWFPACGGSEAPFRTRCGRTLHYLWCPATATHAYYDVTNDVFLTDEEARQLLP